jgi:hypothetical protein
LAVMPGSTIMIADRLTVKSLFTAFPPKNKCMNLLAGN